MIYLLLLHSTNEIRHVGTSGKVQADNPRAVVTWASPHLHNGVYSKEILDVRDREVQFISERGQV